MTVVTSNSYFLHEDYLTGNKTRSKTNTSKFGNNASGAGANTLSTLNHTPSVKIKGVGFEQTPYQKLISLE